MDKKEKLNDYNAEFYGYTLTSLKLVKQSKKGNWHHKENKNFITSLSHVFEAPW